jgi:hypothetical protein
METRNLLERLFNRQTGELEVVTVRTPEGTYNHQAKPRGDIKFTAAEIVDMVGKNIDFYESLMENLDNSVFVSQVTSYIQNYKHGNKTGMSFRTYKRAQNKSLASDTTGAW